MKQITNQIQIEKTHNVKRTLLEKVTRAEIEFNLITPIRNIGYNVNRAD